MPVAYFFRTGGSNTPIIVWILYADHGLAPFPKTNITGYDHLLVIQAILIPLLHPQSLEHSIYRI